MPSSRLLSSCSCGRELGSDQNDIAFVALQMVPSVQLSLPVTRLVLGQEHTGRGFCPETQEDMSPCRYILLIASDDVVESFVTYVSECGGGGTYCVVYNVFLTDSHQASPARQTQRFE